MLRAFVCAVIVNTACVFWAAWAAKIHFGDVFFVILLGAVIPTVVVAVTMGMELREKVDEPDMDLLVFYYISFFLVDVFYYMHKLGLWVTVKTNLIFLVGLGVMLIAIFWRQIIKSMEDCPSSLPGEGCSIEEHRDYCPGCRQITTN
ncbi:hypothetical protein KKG41_00720 [Patescibacteria group bacterium]|nr:hypothetical protein [Patescibacteria group bacterium]MBU1891030.1 hypothetical protein [Patescibacteria group bacterium]